MTHKGRINTFEYPKRNGYLSNHNTWKKTARVQVNPVRIFAKTFLTYI